MDFQFKGNTDHQTPFILTALYIHVHVAILVAQFLFFFLSFCNTRCRCASTKRYDNLKSGEDKTLGKLIFLVVSVLLFLERSCPHQNTILK